MNSPADKQTNSLVRGYLEGYYGKLFSWNERVDLLKFLSSKNLNTYCYAPKEDTKHRLHWRNPYSANWLESFSEFTATAKTLNVSVTAGIAPGLDFHFEADGVGKDFDQLLNKSKSFLANGASDVLILWDDIDEDGYTNHYGLSEGSAHAQTVNKLSEAIGQPLWTVPRVYATDIDNNQQYLEDFFSTLDSQHTVLLCGQAIVPSSVHPEDLMALSVSAGKNASNTTPLKHRTVVWDNFYANDYCPRRLFVGPWTGRDQVEHYLLNPTGLPYTDRLLLDVAVSTQTSPDPYGQWQKVLIGHGVPEAFQTIAPYFSHPFFGDQTVTGTELDTACEWPSNDTTSNKPASQSDPNIQNDSALQTELTESYRPFTQEIEQAIEHCLWKWKTPLAREWYPYIFGLKHDLAIAQNTLPTDRILKTQSPLLANRLLR